jgi:hypothetical protein
MWTAIGLVASGAAQRLMKGLSAAFEWLLSDPRHIPLVVCAAMWAINALLIVPGRDRQIAALETSLTAEQSAHLGTVNAFLAASAQAQREAEANVVRVRAEQEIITGEVTRDLRSDLAAVSARFDRLRARNAAAINPGHADAAGLPVLPDAAGRAAAAAPDHNLPAAGELSPKAYCPAGLVCLTIDEAEAASLDAHNHNALIDWVWGQSAVRFVPEGAAQ